MSRLNKRELALNIYYFLFCFILGSIFFRDIYHGYSKQSWNITEFLINYEGGFVRRGLLGQIILNIYHYAGIYPYYSILFISITAYLVLIWFFVRSFMRQGYTSVSYTHLTLPTKRIV